MYTASIGPDTAVRVPYSVGALIVQLDGNVVQSVPLGPRPLTIGRLPDNGLVLANPMVSRHHAELRVEAAGPVLTDVGSSSGTFVGESRLAPNQPVVLQTGDIVRIGPFALTYEFAAPAVSEAPPPMVAPASPAGAAAPTPQYVPVVGEEALPDAQRRPTLPMPVPDLREKSQSRYLQDLPAIFQDDGFLGRMLLIFEAIWEPLEQRQDHVALYFDPRTAPRLFLPWLASWLRLALNEHWPEERQRRLLAEAMDLYRWRGTPYGLTRMIEVCTGITPVITEERAEPFTFRIAVRVPPGSDARPEFIEELVRAHKPAHVGYVLEIR